MSPTSWTHERAKVASLTRSRPVDDPELIAARQRLKAMRLYDHVREVVESAPPLTEQQCNAIAALLAAGGVR